jgi:peptidyl-prolyl cis-trans isomerase SurA
MRRTEPNTIRRGPLFAAQLLSVALLCCEALGPRAMGQPQSPVSAPLNSQSSASQSSAQSADKASKAATPPAQAGVELDRLVAVANDAVILESDLDEERRLAVFQPFRDTRQRFSREQVIDRLIDRALILQQARLQPEGKVTDSQVDEELAALRRDIPACREYHCDTEAGWQKFVSDQGFTLEELRNIWRQRMEVLRFIEMRFRTGVHISDAEIREYYQQTLLPQYAGKGVTPPKFQAISDRIEEILLQRQVSNLLADWLKSLRAQGTVRTIQPGEASP